MRKLSAVLLPVLGAAVLLGVDQSKIPAMPAAVTGNAVASLKGGLEIYSLMGVGQKKTWDDVSNQVYELRLSSGKWTTGHPVPGVAGRLGASAIGAKGQIFVFGGYVVDSQGNEITVGDVNSYFADAHRWYRAEDIPVPVDSAVIGVTHDRYIYLIGGRSKSGPVNNVQVYDIEKNAWSQATPFPGTPVFGHAGALADETIVYVDGAKKNTDAGTPLVASDQCWMGRIDHKDPNKIDWSKIPPHPGPGRFGIAAGVGEGHKILFSGGTALPHNFKGLDSEGKPAELSTVSFAYELHGNKWETLSEDTFDVRTDARGIVLTPIGTMVIGGMVSNHAVTARAMLLTKR